MLQFTDPIKIYVFKRNNEVKISFMLSAHCTMDKWIKQNEFEYILNNWRSGVSGVETSMGRVWWEHRTVGPRPTQAPADFVAISFAEWNFRISQFDMQQLEQEYHRQCNNANHWD